MKIISLQSGSNGNCIYVESGGTRLLVDAGISGIKAQRRLAEHGRDIADVDAVLISHDHRDHIACAGVYQRKFGLPLYVTEGTLEAGRRHSLGELKDVRHFDASTRLRFGKVAVEALPTPHDGVESVAFVIDDGRHRLGILTDLGHVFDGLDTAIASLDAVLLESNYDPQMLAACRYPEPVKARIRGPAGHLSNREAAELILANGHRLRWICLAHLSQDSNTPERALRVHQEVLGDRLPVHVATRYGATSVIEL